MVSTRARSAVVVEEGSALDDSQTSYAAAAGLPSTSGRRGGGEPGTAADPQPQARSALEEPTLRPRRTTRSGARASSQQPAAPSSPPQPRPQRGPQPAAVLDMEEDPAPSQPSDTLAELDAAPRPVDDDVGDDAGSGPGHARAAGAAAGAETDGDDDEDDDLNSEALLDALADSIRSAWGPLPGSGQRATTVQAALQPPRNSARAAAPAAGSTAAATGGAPGWRPDMALAPLLRELLPPAEGARGAAAARVALPAKEQGLTKQLMAPPRDPARLAKAARKAAPDTAGAQWYHLPSMPITDDVKRDLRLLRLRSAYDPKRFYRSADDTKFPRHFQFGTVVNDPLDGPQGRLPKAQRRATLTEQLLADPELRAVRKRRYAALQEKAHAGAKVKRRKTSLPRHKAPKHRPKH